MRGERQEILTSDGVRLVARYVPAKGSTITVVMLPMLGNTAEAYAQLQARFESRGVASLVYDLRGQGESSSTLAGALVDYHRFANAPQGEWGKLSQDVGMVVDFLARTQGATSQSVVLIGASIGANAALNYAAGHKEISKVVLLSAGEEYRGLESLSAAQSYGARPLLILCGKRDGYAAQSSEKIAERAKQGGAQVTLKFYNTGDHGTAMLNSSVQEEIVAWVVDGVR